MPNYCNFTMKIKGKAGDIMTLANWLNADYHYVEEGNDASWNQPPKNGSEVIFKEGNITLYTNEEHHFYRVFSFDVGDITEEDDGLYSVIGFGDCAWSVYSCMFDGPQTYYGDHKDGGVRTHAITIPDACEKLGVWVEIFSSEPGCCFAEHYRVSNTGAIEENEEYDYSETWLEEYENKEAAEEELGRKISDDEWDQGYVVNCEINPDEPEWFI